MDYRADSLGLRTQGRMSAERRLQMDRTIQDQYLSLRWRPLHHQHPAGQGRLRGQAHLQHGARHQLGQLVGLQRGLGKPVKRGDDRDAAATHLGVHRAVGCQSGPFCRGCCHAGCLVAATAVGQPQLLQHLFPHPFLRAILPLRHIPRSGDLYRHRCRRLTPCPLCQHRLRWQICSLRLP